MLSESWMPSADMKRVHIHWTAGTYKANAVDRRHYHLLVEGDGNIVKGNPSIKDNEPPLRRGYAAHTRAANSRAIGVAMCGMAGAREVPFRAGSYPLTKIQWDVMIVVVARLCERYGIPVTPKTVLTHAEVQTNLGIRQRSKWDITRLPFDDSVRGAKAIGDKLRAAVANEMAGVTDPGIDLEDESDEPSDPPLVEPISDDRPAWAVALFEELGWSRVASVAMVGNFQQEAYKDLRTDAVGDPHIPGGSIGLAQWNRSRKIAFLAFCENIGKPYTDLEANILFADHELRTTEKTWGRLLAEATTIYSATKWAISFFRPQGWSALFPQGGHGWRNRLNNAIALNERLAR